MAGWEQLGEVLGGGIDRQGAFQTGMLRSAQTESAIGQARQRQLENIALETKNRERERLRETLAGNPNIDPTQVDTLAAVMLGNMGSDFKAGAEGMGEFQTQGFRSTLADPTAPLGDQFAAGQGIQGEVLPRYAITGTTAEDLFNRDAPLAPTPVGEADIAADTALAELRDRTPRLGGQSSGGGAGPDGMKPPNNFMRNPAFNPAQPMTTENPPFVPIPGSPADPNAPAAPGSREAVFNERVFQAVAQTIPDVTNMLLLPSTANTGVFGIGERPGKSVTQASIDALRNTLSGEVVRAYEQQVQQLGRNLAQIESNGLQPSTAFINSYDNLVLRPGSTGFDALRSFANVRQTIDQSIRVKMANPRVPSAQKELLREFNAEIQRAIPFTVEDVQRLQFGDGRYQTMADVVKEKGFGTPSIGAQGAQPAAPASAGATPPREFASEAEAEAAAARGELQPGTKVVVGGIPGMWQ